MSLRSVLKGGVVSCSKSFSRTKRLGRGGAGEILSFDVFRNTGIRENSTLSPWSRKKEIAVRGEVGVW